MTKELREVQVAPVFIEPLAGGGELLCVGVVAIMDGQADSVLLPDLRRLKCVYGPAYRTLQIGAECAVASLRAHVQLHGLTAHTNAEWSSPVGGVTLGPVTTTTTRSVQQVMDVYLRAHSSLAASTDAAAMDEKEERGANISAARLERMVKEAVVAARGDLDVNFNRTFRIAANARPMRLGYAGTRIVTNFALLWPTQLTGAVRSSKAKLWDLAQARDGSSHGWFGEFAPQAFELLVHPASKDDVVFSDSVLLSVAEALAELEVEADRYKLRCRSVRGANAMATFLLQAETGSGV